MPLISLSAAIHLSLPPALSVEHSLPPCLPVTICVEKNLTTLVHVLILYYSGTSMFIEGGAVFFLKTGRHPHVVIPSPNIYAYTGIHIYTQNETQLCNASAL